MPEAPRLTRCGWVLWACSLITPDADLDHVGAYMFLFAPRYGAELAFQLDNPADTVVGWCLLLCVLANVTLLLRLPKWAALAALILPWLPFAALVGWVATPGHRLDTAVDALYFYPWMAGITLIHVGRMRRSMCPGFE